MIARFLPELALVPQGSSVIVDGAADLIRLTDRSDPTLGALLPLIDGTKTIDDLARAIGRPSEQVGSALEALAERGLVELVSAAPAAAPHDPVRPATTTLGFLRRFASVTRHSPNGQHAYERLRASVVFVTEPTLGTASTLLESLLLHSGVGTVHRVPASQLAAAFDRRDSSNAICISLIATGDEASTAQEIAVRCRPAGARWLPAFLDVEAGHADVGPLCSGQDMPCEECVAALRRNRLLRPASIGNGSGDQIAMWVSLIALETIYEITRIAVSHLTQGFRRFDLSTWIPKDISIYRCQDCPRCGAVAPRHDDVSERRAVIANGAGAPRVEPAVIFEEIVSARANVVAASDIARDRTRVGAMLGRQTKRLPTCRRVALETSAAFPGTDIADSLHRQPPTKAVVTMADLSALLERSVGIRADGRAKGTPTRWAASGGNLGSAEAYVYVRRVADLAQGLYFYQAGDHSLACIEWIEDEVARSLGALFARVAGPAADVVIVLTAALHRLTPKYGPFGYRLAHFDAGVAASQMMAVGVALGLDCLFSGATAEPVLSASLGLRPHDEISTGLVAIRSVSASSADLRGPAVIQRDADSHVPAPPPRPYDDFAEISAADVFKMLLEDGLRADTTPVVACAPPELTARLTGNACGCDHDGVPLPEAERRTCALGDVLERRESVRVFSPAPLSSAALSQTLRIAWPSGIEEAWKERLSLTVCVRRVDGLPAGVYRYCADHYQLLPIRHGLSNAEAAELFVQAELADAPVHLWIAGDLAAACAAESTPGYRRLLLHAGIVVHRLSFATFATGGVGTMVAGVVGAAARRLCGFDTSHHAPLLAFLCGRPTSAASDTARRPVNGSDA